MKKSVSALFLVLLGLPGCAHGPRASVPPVSSPDEAAEVIVIRNKNIFGSTNSYLILLDGQQVFAIRVGDYTSFKLEPGRHSIGVEWLYAWPSRWKETNLDMLFHPRTKYFFLVGPHGKAVTIEQVSEQRGLELISKSTYIPMTQ